MLIFMRWMIQYLEVGSCSLFRWRDMLEDLVGVDVSIVECSKVRGGKISHQ